jgi:NSS family neurotransmitter:Na+ symporter
MTVSERDGFTTSLGVLVATPDSAVGLGNIWNFPLLSGTNGGAGFPLVYLLATLLVGLPVMIAETMLGRAAWAKAVSTFERMAPRHRGWWKIIGWMGFLAALLILAVYSEVAGWVYAYIVKAIAGDIATTDPRVAGVVFADLVASPPASLLWQWVVRGVTSSIIMLGVAKGIEAVARKLMPLLFILLLLCAGSLTLPGAAPGLTFLFSVQPGSGQDHARGAADGTRTGFLQAIHRHGLQVDLWELFPRGSEHPGDGRG